MRKAFTWLFFVLGIALILGAAAMVVLDQMQQKENKSQADTITQTLMQLMPEEFAAAPDDRLDMAMPRISVDQEDFVAILTIPGYGKTLPVYAQWDTEKLSHFPCRYTGSMYDGSLILGATDQAGQLDITKQLCIYNYLSLTDMSGARFSYSVTDIFTTDDVSTQTLRSFEADLVLFVRNTYSLDYTVILCSL